MSKGWFEGVLCDRCIHGGERVGTVFDRKVKCKDGVSIIRVHLCKDFKEKEKPPAVADGISKKF